MKRRQFVRLAPLSCPFATVDFAWRASGLLTEEDQESAVPGTHKPPSAEEWMEAWMNSPTRGGDSPLIMGRFLEPMYFLTQPITWTPNPDQKGYSPVTAPVGFVTDLASIPRPFFSAFRPDGQYAYPAIIHDYLYWAQTRPRDVADMIFKFGMQDFEVDHKTIEVIYQAVRHGGGPSWNENQALKRNGEKRILKKFPPSARIRWTKWKNEQGVFEDR